MRRRPAGGRRLGAGLQCQDPRAYAPGVTAVAYPDGHSADKLRTVILERFNMSLGNGLGRDRGQGVPHRSHGRSWRAVAHRRADRGGDGVAGRRRAASGGRGTGSDGLPRRRTLTCRVRLLRVEAVWPRSSWSSSALAARRPGGASRLLPSGSGRQTGVADEATFADLVALCQFMPGPASSQTGMAIGLLAAARSGCAGLGRLHLAFGAGDEAVCIRHRRVGDLADAGWLRGLKLVAVAVVAQAVWGMARPWRRTEDRATLAGVACLMCLAEPVVARVRWGRSCWAGWFGLAVLGRRKPTAMARGGAEYRHPCTAFAISLLVLFFVLLLGHAMARGRSPDLHLRLS